MVDFNSGDRVVLVPMQNRVLYIWGKWYCYEVLKEKYSVTARWLDSFVWVITIWIIYKKDCPWINCTSIETVNRED